MLVLTRRAGQSVYIGDEIKITLVDIKGNQVRIGVDAPPSVRIFREEIYQQILEENQSAAALSAEVPTDLGAVADQWKEKKPRPLGKFKADSKKGSEE